MIKKNSKRLLKKWKPENCPSTQSVITCSKLAIETLERGVKYVQSLTIKSVFIVNFEHISHLALVLLLLTLSR